MQQDDMSSEKAITSGDASPTCLLGLLQQFNNCNPAYVFLTTKEAAVFLRVSYKKLEADRLHGTGPPFKKVGAKVIYCLKELLAYLEDNTRLNTCK